MRILIVSNLYPPNVVGGYERLCHQVAAALAERGHEIVVLTSDYGGRVAEIPDQRVYRTLQLLADRQDIYRPFEASREVRNAINGSNVAELARVVADTRPDVIFCWNLYFFDRSFQAALAQQPAPVAYFLTDNWMIAALTPERIGQFFERHVNGSAPFTAEAAAVPADHHIGGSALFGARFVRRLYHSCGFAFEHESVIHNGVDLPALDAELLPDRTHFVHPGQVRLLFAGRLVDLKGAHDCVAALPLISRALPDLKIHLTLMGDAQDQAYRQKLVQQVESLGVAAQVEIAPPVPETRLVEAFMAHDIYLFPSLYEPFALTLIHALGAGMPTVASDVGGNVEIILDRRTGLIFRKSDAGDLAAKVIALAGDPELRASISARAQRMAQRFSFGRMVRQVEQAIGDAAARRQPAGRRAAAEAARFS